jgi:hypothetical protein
MMLAVYQLAGQDQAMSAMSPSQPNPPASQDTKALRIGLADYDSQSRTAKKFGSSSYKA